MMNDAWTGLVLVSGKARPGWINDHGRYRHLSISNAASTHCYIYQAWLYILPMWGQGQPDPTCTGTLYSINLNQINGQVRMYLRTSELIFQKKKNCAIILHNTIEIRLPLLYTVLPSATISTLGYRGQSSVLCALYSAHSSQSLILSVQNFTLSTQFNSILFV